MMVKNKNCTMIAIDEAGRGPLAGPIAVAAVLATTNSKLLKNIKDSKKLSALQRERWFKIIKNNFEYRVAMVGPRIIDQIGINPATRLAVARVIRRLKIKPGIVLLDGAMHAPKKYNQKTIIRGDEKIPLISAASIMAKVTRDKKMLNLHKDYPEYFWDCHKGYGTKLHYAMIKKNGLSPFHRRSFLKKICG